MSFIQDDRPIQELTTDRADQPLAEGISPASIAQRLKHRQTHCGNRLVDRGG